LNWSRCASATLRSPNLSRRARATLRAVALLAAIATPAFAAHPISAEAQSAAPDAQRFLEARHHEVNRVLSQPPNDARNQRLEQLLDGLLDYQELARRALARHWEERSPAERQQFSDLLHELVSRSYKDNLQRTLSFEVQYLGEDQRGDSVVVRTRARNRQNRRAQPVEIDYVMHRDANGWRVYDVSTDGVSLVENYRTQFNRIIDREGFDGLLRRMRTRINNGADAI
jgi:phospholipid transport system substrate-binding protein